MKKSLIALTVLAAFAGAAQAQSSVTLYGIADAGLDFSNNGNDSVNRVESGYLQTSRFGLKGSEDLGNGLKGIFNLESGLRLDTGTSTNSSTLFDRAAYAGVAGSFGTVALGRQATPLFITQATYTLGKGGMAWGNASNYFAGGWNLSSRYNNAITYSTPNLSGFTSTVYYSFGEKVPVAATATAPAVDKTTNNVFTFNLNYVNGPVGVSYAYLTNKVSTLNKEKTQSFGGSYDFGVVKLGLLYTTFRNDTAAVTKNDSNTINLGALVPLGGGNLLLDYGKIKDKVVDANGAKAYSIRYDYPISKRTTVYTGFAKVKNDAGAAYGIAGAGNTAIPGVAAGSAPRSIIFGMNHAF